MIMDLSLMILGKVPLKMMTLANEKAKAKAKPKAKAKTKAKAKAKAKD